VNVRIGRWWWGAAIPLAVAVVVVVLAVLFGATAPSSSDLAMAAAGALITLPIVLVINGPLGEELGWRGYVLPLFLRRHSPVMATILLIPLWICFHLPLIVTSPDRFGLWWALAVAGTAFPMTWLHLRSGGSVALAIGFHAVMNVATPAAVGLFAGPDRLLAMHLTAVVWVLIGLATAVGLLRRDPTPPITTVSRALRFSGFAGSPASLTALCARSMVNSVWSATDSASSSTTLALCWALRASMRARACSTC
jgi:membrane protease YdiL (CAAX protease family)